MNLKDILEVIEFLDELLGLPPNHEVEFSIELIPHMTLILQALYRITSKELKELKT